jgi:hypothetical protein
LEVTDETACCARLCVNLKIGVENFITLQIKPKPIWKGSLRIAQVSCSPGGKRVTPAFWAFWRKAFPERLSLNKGPVIMRTAPA